MNNVLNLDTNFVPTKSGILVSPEVKTAAEKFATKASNNANIQDALHNAGLNWEVELKPLYTPDGVKVPNRAVARKDTGDILGVVGSKYTPVQNGEAFGFFNDFLESGDVELTTAGQIGNGQRVFIQAKINNTEARVIGDDTITNYLTIGKAHNGSMALNVGFTPIRMFCANQLNAVTNKAESKMLKFRHTPKIHENLEQVAAILNLAKQDFEATLAQYQYLATQTVNSAEELAHYIKVVFAGENYKELEATGKTPASKIVTNIFTLFETGRGANKTENTYWKAYNAINEYLNHERGQDDAKRFDSISFGDSKNVDLRALSVAMKITA